MKQLQQAATREHRAPILWWFVMSLIMGVALVLVVREHADHAAFLVAVLLAAAWLAPLVAFLSLAAPRRAALPPPGPGMGSYREWRKQAFLLGRVLLYHEDNLDLPPELKKIIHQAREDLRDTLKSHPLRDDLERVCGRLRDGALRDLKRWFWREYRARVRDIRHAYDQQVAAGLDENERLIALQTAVEDAAAVMTRRCMPRMLERERLACARDCAWLAAQAASGANGAFSPIELAGALVVEWTDFSQPWLPARMLQQAAARLDPAPSRSAPPAAAEGGPAAASAPATGAEPAPPPAAADGLESADGEAPASADARKLRRVRVRVRRRHRRHSRHYSGPSLLDILLSFGQWVRYSVRAWLLYR